MKVKFHINDWEALTKFYFYRGDENRGPIEIVTSIHDGRNIEMRRIDPVSEALPHATLEIGDMDARQLIQSFLDEAWNAGMRPTKEQTTREQVEKEIKRLEAHLEDMRKLVFSPQQEMQYAIAIDPGKNSKRVL
jgi:hypothetical protein